MKTALELLFNIALVIYLALTAVAVSDYDSSGLDSEDDLDNEPIVNEMPQFTWPNLDDSVADRAVIEARSMQKFAELLPFLHDSAWQKPAVKWILETKDSVAAHAIFIRAINTDFYESDPAPDVLEDDGKSEELLPLDDGRANELLEGQADDVDDESSEDQSEDGNDEDLETFFRAMFKFQSWLDEQVKPYLTMDSYLDGRQPPSHQSAGTGEINGDEESLIVESASYAEDLQVASQVLAAIQYVFKVGVEDRYLGSMSFASFMISTMQNAHVEESDQPAVTMEKLHLYLKGVEERFVYENLFGTSNGVADEQPNRFREVVERMLASYFWAKATTVERNRRGTFNFIADRMILFALEAGKIRMASLVFRNNILGAINFCDVVRLEGLFKLYHGVFIRLDGFRVGAKISISGVNQALQVVTQRQGSHRQYSGAIELLRAVTERPELEGYHVQNLFARINRSDDSEYWSDEMGTLILMHLCIDIDRIEDGDNGPPLKAAIQNSGACDRAIRVVKFLLHLFKSDPNLMFPWSDPYSRTSPKRMISALSFAILDFRVDSCMKVVNLLIKAGANINLAADDNLTPLFQAATLGRREVVTLLLKRGATFQRVRSFGIGPLAAAAMSEHGEIVSDLLLFMTTNKLPCQDCDVALAYCAAFGDLKNMQSIMELDSSVINVDIGPKMARDSPPFRTPLTMAALNGQLEAVKLLLNWGAQVDLGPKMEDTAVYIAKQKDHKKIVDELEAALKAERERNRHVAISISHGLLPTGNGDLELDS